MLPNTEFSTDFEIDTASKAVLSIAHNGDPNREKITAQELGSTSFNLKLTHVQYGTFEDRPAVLLKLHAQFGFINESIKRITSATVRLTFQETLDSTLQDPDPPNPLNDPQVTLIAPVQICGEATTSNESRDWALEIPVMYQSLGAQAGMTSSFSRKSDFSRDHRMWVTGMTMSDDDHYHDNIAQWHLRENQTQKSGIPHLLPIVVVATLPRNPTNPIKLSAMVRPFVAFTINPLRLKQKRDDPIFLDIKTAKGVAVAPGVDFGAKEFPWSEFIEIPGEYEVRLVSTSV